MYGEIQNGYERQIMYDQISKPYGYLTGLLLTLIIYFIGQLFFFINAEKATGNICQIKMSRGSLRYRGTAEIFYVCFTTKDNLQVKARGGSNFEYVDGEQIELYYKKIIPDISGSMIFQHYGYAD